MREGECMRTQGQCQDVGHYGKKERNIDYCGKKWAYEIGRDYILKRKESLGIDNEM